MAFLVGLAALLVVPAAAKLRTRGNDVDGVSGDPFYTSGGGSGDFMDRYIAASSASRDKPNVWWDKPSSGGRSHIPTAAAADGSSPYPYGSGGASYDFRPRMPNRTPLRSGGGSPDPFARVHEDAMRSRSPQDSPADSPLRSPQDSPADSPLFVSNSAEEVQAAAAAAPPASSNQGGSVVDITLDSELQEAKTAKAILLQKHARGLKSKAKKATKDAPASANSVADAVEQQRLQDIYIHDDFSEAAASDSKEAQVLEDRKDMKA